MEKKQGTKLSVTVSNSMDAGIETLIKGGEFTSKNEYARCLIRDDLRRRAAKDQINTHLLAGLASGEAQPADWDAITAEITAQEKGT